MSYLYMLRADGPDVFKVGIATNFKERRHTLQGMCPFRLMVERVLLVESRNVALAFESWICANATSANMHGEWFRDRQKLHSLFDRVTPADDVTAEFNHVPGTVPRYRDGSDERLAFDLLFARAADCFGSNYRTGVYLTGDRNFNAVLRAEGIKPEWMARLQEVVDRHAN